MALTKATYSMIDGQPVSVFDYGAVGDGSADDTAAIQAAINTGRSVYFPAGTYKVSGLIVEDKSNVSYFANDDATITNVGATLTGQVFKFVGTLENITWSGLNIIGNSVVTSNNSAFGCASGQTGVNLTFENLYIEAVSVGISLNADLAGSFNNCFIRNCQFKDIVGEAAGTAYAVHLPYAYDTIVDSCTFDNVSRHAVYVPRGGRVTISNCHILNHRKDVATALVRPAVLIARNSRDCQIIGCTFDTYWDGAIGITSETAAIADTENNTIFGCTFRNPQNAAARAITVGEQVNPSGGAKVNGLIIEACQFHSDGAVFTPTNINVLNGWNIHVRNCFFNWVNVAGNVVGVDFGSSNSPSVDDCAWVSSEGCVFYAKGTSGQLRAVITQGYLGSNVDRRVTVNNTQFFVDSGITLLTWHSPSYSYANTAVQGTGRFGDIGRGLGTAAPTSGTWYRGDIIWDITPSAGGTIGWVCTTAGTPGTWKTFGTIAS